jgi:hypothetical protein
MPTGILSFIFVSQDVLQESPADQYMIRNLAGGI